MPYVGIDAKNDIRLNATSDLDLTSDSTTIKFGADDDVILTHVHNTGLLLNSTNQFQFGDSGTYIHQSADGVLDLVSDTEIEINATTIDINGNVDISGTMNASGTIGAPKGVFTSSNAGQVTLNSTSSDYMLEFQTNGTSEWWIRSSAASWKVAENGVGDHLTILASNGNVGLGTNSPADTGGFGKALDVSSSTGAAVYMRDAGGSKVGHIGQFNEQLSITSRQDDGNISFFTGASPTEKMRITSSGSVGIGTNSPTAKFVVQDSSLPKIESNYNNSKHLDMGNGGSGCGFAMTTGHFMTFNHQPYANRGTDTNLTERMRIDSSGKINIGTSGHSAGYSGYNLMIRAASPMIKLESTSSDNTWDLYNNGGTTFIFGYNAADKASINQSTGAYTALSDANKKKDFEESNIGLEAVMQLQPKLFRMLDETSDTPKHLGFIAQEVEPIIPQAYVEETNDNDTFIGLQDRPIIAVLTKAIQEMSDKIKTLEAKIAKLEGV